MNDKEFYDSLRVKYNNVLNAPDDEIKNVYQSTLKAEPKQVANIMNVANKINAHPIAVQNDLKGATEAANMPADEYWEHLRKNRPITYNYLSEPLNMAATKDIIQEQDNREGIFQQITHGYRSGDLNVMQGQLGSQQVLAVLSGGDPNINENSLKDIESEMDELNQTAPKGWTIAPAYFVANQIPNLLFGAQKAIERGAPGAIAATGAAALAGQFGPQVLIPEEVITLPTAFGIGLAAGGKVGYAEATAILETGSAYRDFIKLKDRNGKPVDKKTAAYYALAVGAVNSGLEMATLNTFLKAIGAQKVVELLGTKQIKELVKKKTAGKAIKKAFGDYLKAIGTETATEVLQEVSNVAAKSAIEGELEAGKGLEQIAGVISPTIQATAANPLTLLGLGTNTIENLHQVNRAKANAEFYSQVGQNSNNSELLKRYPNGFKTIVAQQTAGTPIENVYIDAEQFVTLMQEQNPDILNASELVAKQLGFDDQLQTALETGDKIKVSLADWTANVAPTEFYEKIKPHVSFSADGLTLFQAEQEEKRIGEKIKSEQQKAAELMAQDEEKQTAYNTIYEDVKSKLLEAGRPENIKEKSWNSYVDKSAKLWASHAFAEASRRQMSVAEWYQGANVPQITKEQPNLKEGFFLSQDQTIPRGFVKITPEGSLVGLLGSSDASTFLHESAHIFLKDAFEFIKSGQADEEYLKDWQVLKDWLKITDDQTELTEGYDGQQEQFARGFEAYLYEGKSPSEGLRKAFAAFRRWLTRIYKDVKGLDVELSDPVRQVMDRMLATDEEIAEAEALSGYNEDIITEADVTSETWAKLQDIKTRAHEEAVNRLLKKQMDELKEENKQFLKNEQEAFRGLVEEEIFKEPVYQTMEEVRSKFGGKNIKDTANKYINKELTFKGQNKFDTIAETNGYSSGSELAQIIINTPSFNEVVDQRLNEHMEQYSDLMNTARIKEAALEAIRNEKQLEFEALERELIMEFVQKAEAGQARRQSALERSRIAVGAAKNHAKEILSRKNYKESTAFKSYFKAERDAAVKAALALKSGNDAAAARFAEQRMLNHALAMEAIKNQKDVQKYLNYFKKFQRRHGNLLKMPAEFMTQIESIMERFGLIEPVQREEKPESILDFVERMTNEYHDIPISDDILSGMSKPLNELTLGELKDVYNSVKTIATLGNKWTRFYSDFLKAELNEVGKEIADSIVKNVGEKKADTERFTTPKKGIQKASKLAEEINNWLVKPEFLARFLDGNQDGPMQKYFIELFNRTWTDEKILEQKTVTEFKKLINRYFTENELSKISKEMIFLPEVGQSMSKEQIITAVLNMGNEQNKQRLIDGHNLTEEMAKSIVDVLNEKELQMVQDIWNFIETFWPAIAKLEEEVTGVVPEKVEAVPLETKFGTLSGGYYPIKYDAEKSIRMSKYEEQTNALYKETPAAKAATRHGHTKKRAKTVNHKLNLSFGVIPNHLVNVVHDLTHRKAIIDANRLLRQEDVQRAITNAVGIKGYKLLENSVKAIASDQGEYLDVADKAFRWMRSRTTLGAMGLNLRVALLQTSGFFQSAWEIGAIPTMKGITEFASNPVESWKFVKEKSVFMTNRSQLVDRDIYDFSRRMFKGDNKIQRYAYSLIGIMDQSVSVPTWLGAYKKELEKSGDEEAAIRAGDGAVRRSQGTGSVKDLSASQRGTELKKLFTMFYSYGNLLYNRFWLATSTAGVQLSKGQHEEAIKNIAAMTFYGWILPGTFEFVLREAVRSHEDDDPEKFTKRLIASMASGLLQTIPIVRDVGSYLLNKALGVYSSFRATPIESSIESIGNVVTKGRKLIEETGDWIDFGEAASKTGAFVSGIPQQTVTWVFNFLDWMENNGEADWRDLFSRRRD